jgi:hypothetical protein
MLTPKLDGTDVSLILEYVFSGVLCSPLIFLLALIMFESWRGFFQAIAQSLRVFGLPEFIYVFKGDYWEDRVGLMKLVALLMFSAIGIYFFHRLFFHG